MKEFIPNGQIEKELMVFNETDSNFRIRIAISWTKEKTIEGVQQIVDEAKKVLDSMLHG